MDSKYGNYIMTQTLLVEDVRRQTAKAIEKIIQDFHESETRKQIDQKILDASNHGESSISIDYKSVAQPKDLMHYYKNSGFCLNANKDNDSITVAW